LSTQQLVHLLLCSWKPLWEVMCSGKGFLFQTLRSSRKGFVSNK
jgi:hypothetical protein